MAATCRGCGAAVIWAKTPAGKPMPLDAQPRPDGNIWLHAGIAHVGDPPSAIGDVDRYVSHFATCPKAGQFRKKAISVRGAIRVTVTGAGEGDTTASAVREELLKSILPP